MNFSILSASDRRIVMTAGATALLAVLTMFDRGGWGVYVVLALLASLGVVAVVMWPQISPSAPLPVAKGLAVLVLSAVAAGGFVLAAIVYLPYLFSLSSLIFDAGLVVSIALLYFSWLAYQADTVTGPTTTPTGAAPVPTDSMTPPPPAEPPAPEG